jgi:hypothetical protein
MPSELEGGCLCGAIRYAIADVYDSAYCHCSICRRTSGAPAVVWANLRSRDFRLTKGEPTRFPSSERWLRFFCGICGSPIFQRTANPPEDGSDLVCILAPTLDDPEAVRPTAHIWCASKLSYFDDRGSLPRFPAGELSDPGDRAPCRTR